MKHVANALATLAIIAAAFLLVSTAQAVAADDGHPCEGIFGVRCCACSTSDGSCLSTTNDAHLECLPAKGACYGECEGA